MLMLPVTSKRCDLLPLPQVQPSRKEVKKERISNMDRATAKAYKHGGCAK